MSWSVSQMIGTPKAVKQALQKQFDNYGAGPAKEEFAAAKPHLDALLDEYAGARVHVEFSASGSASTIDGVKTEGSVAVSIRPIYHVVTEA